MSEKKQVRSLTCTADGYEYQITSDDRNLYFNKLGRDGAENTGSLMGTIRVVKAEVEAVRCMRVHGKTVIIIVFEGKTSRLVVKGNVKEELLMRIFGGVPLKLSINAHSTVLTDTYELRLLSASFMVTLLYVLCQYMKEIRFLIPFVELGWIAVPFFWLVPCAGRMLKGSLRDQFPMGGGMLASIFSCVMLWVTSIKGVESWIALILPSVIIAMIMGATYLVARRKMNGRALMAVVLAALLLYAPAASMNLNRLLPAWSVKTSAAEITGLNESICFGERVYEMTVDEDGAQNSYLISKAEYASAEEGASVQIHHKTGLLGIPYRDIEFE